MTLLPATADEKEEILSLNQRRMKDSPLKDCYDDYLVNKDILFLVYHENEKVQGYLILRLEGEEAELDEIAILEEIEGQGKGSELLNLGILEAKRRDVKTLLLEVRSQNKKALSLYERLGFSFYRKRAHYYPDDDALCYKKEL